MMMKPHAIPTWWATAADKQHGDRAGLARLRHCATVVETLTLPVTIGLFRASGGSTPADLETAGLIGAVLSHVRQDVPGLSVARSIGPATPDDHGSARCKPIRFSRVMAAREPDEVLISFVRLVDLMRGEINVADLTHTLLRWDDETRRRWAFEYWNGTVSLQSTATMEAVSP